MTDPTFYLTMAAAALAAVAIVTAATLAGWRGWLQLKGQQFAAHVAAGSPGDGPGIPSAGARIEMADLKERIRKLEAIAAGVDL